MSSGKEIRANQTLSINPAFYNAFKLGAAAMGLTIREATDEAMNDWIDKHRGLINKRLDDALELDRVKDKNG